MIKKINSDNSGVGILIMEGLSLCVQFILMFVFNFKLDNDLQFYIFMFFNQISILVAGYLATIGTDYNVFTSNKEYIRGYSDKMSVSSYPLSYLDRFI